MTMIARGSMWGMCLVSLALLAVAQGCERAASPDGDQDADSVDITAETDDDAPGLDGDTAEDADETPDSDPDAEEVDAPEPEEDEGEEELDGDPEPDPELDLDPEVEEETEWEETPLEPGVIAMDELPWPGLTVTACAVDMNVDASLAESRAVWGDDNGVVYFGGDAFWVLDETNTPGTLTCDAAMPHPMYSMDGRVTATGNELWTGHEGRIGRFVGGGWTFIDLPADMLEGAEITGNDRVFDIDIAGEKIAVLTKVKLGLYAPATGQWQVVETCPEGVNRDYGLAYDGAKLWLSAGVKLYSVALETAQVQEEATVVEEAADGEAVGITGADDSGVWMMAYTIANHPIFDIILFSQGEAVLDLTPVQEDFTNRIIVPPGAGGTPLPGIYFNMAPYWGCPYPPMPTEQFSEGYFRMSLSFPGEQPYMLAPSKTICLVCTGVNLPVCMNQIFNTMFALYTKKAWRGQKQLWHLYQTPRRYRWNKSEQ